MTSEYRGKARRNRKSGIETEIKGRHSRHAGNDSASVTVVHDISGRSARTRIELNPYLIIDLPFSGIESDEITRESSRTTVLSVNDMIQVSTQPQFRVIASGHEAEPHTGLRH